MDAPTKEFVPVSAKLKKSLQHFINHPRPKKDGKQTSIELARFFMTMAMIDGNEDNLLAALHAAFDAYKVSPQYKQLGKKSKLESSALLGNMIIALSPTLFHNLKTRDDIDARIDKADPDKSFDEGHRASTLSLYQDLIAGRVKIDSVQNGLLSVIFLEAILNKNKGVRDSICRALQAYFRKDLTACAKAVKECPEKLWESFGKLYPDLRSMEDLVIPTRTVSTTVLGLFEKTGSTFELSLKRYADDNADETNAVYPPVGKFLSDLVGCMKLAGDADEATKSKPMLQCLLLIINEFLSDKFSKLPLGKFGRSQLVGNLINGLSGLLLDGMALKKYDEAKKDAKIDKSFDVKERISFLEAIKAKIESLLQKAGQEIPHANDPLGKLVSVFIDEKTDQTLRQNTLNALLEYYTGFFQKDFTSTKFVEHTCACDDSNVRWALKNLPDVPREMKEAIQEIESKAAIRADSVAKLAKRDSKAKFGLSSPSLSRRSKDDVTAYQTSSGAAVTAPAVTGNTAVASPAVEKKKSFFGRDSGRK
jgi:hypothetical protein